VHGKHLYVDDLVTDKALRSCGYGRILMERLMARGGRSTAQSSYSTRH